MSYISSDYIECETFQQMLDDNFKVCPAVEEMPALEAILAGQAEAKITQEVSNGDGKVKNVKLVYEPRLLESAVTQQSGTRGCTTTNETFDNYTNYTIDPNVWLEASEKFETENLNTVCTTDVQGMITRKLEKIIDVLDRKTATKTATELVALYGKWASNVAGVTSDELVVRTLINSTTKQLDDTALVDIKLALKQTGYCGNKVIVGGSTLYKFGERINAGCCATTGVNLLDAARQFGVAFAYDDRIATAIGSEDKSIVFQPGSVAMLKYNTAPQVPNLGANYAKFRIASPRTGIWYDITMKDDCGVIHIIGRVTTKLVALPTDMYNVGDKFRGVNFINKIKVDNA